MAVAPRQVGGSLADDDDFDPFGPLELTRVHPVWRLRPDELAHGARVSYDRRSDTLHVHGITDRGNNTVVQVEASRFLLVDRSSFEVVGFHIEGFLSRTTGEFPALAVALDRAELRGITPEEVRAVQRRLGLRSVAKFEDALAEAYSEAGWREAIAV